MHFSEKTSKNFGNHPPQKKYKDHYISCPGTALPAPIFCNSVVQKVFLWVMLLSPATDLEGFWCSFEMKPLRNGTKCPKSGIWHLWIQTLPLPFTTAVTQNMPLHVSEPRRPRDGDRTIPQSCSESLLRWQTRLSSMGLKPQRELRKCPLPHLYSYTQGLRRHRPQLGL